MLKRKSQVLAILALVVFVALSSEGMAFAPQHMHAGQTALTSTCYQYSCDGRAVDGTTCQQDQIKEVNIPVYSKYQPGRYMFDFWIFYSPGCKSAWTAIANRSGVTLNNVNVLTCRGMGCTGGGPTSLANGAHISTPMLGGKPGDFVSGSAWVNDIGNHGVLYAPSGYGFHF